MSTAKEAFQTLKQQRSLKDEKLRETRKKGSKFLRYVGLIMMLASLGLLTTSAVFMDLVNKSENMILGSIPIGLFAASLGLVGGLCEFCASRNMVESEATGCSKGLVIGNFILSFVALSQCVISSAFAGMTYSTCGEDPGPPPDPDSWFRTDFRQCVSYRSEIRTTAVFIFGEGHLAIVIVVAKFSYSQFPQYDWLRNCSQILALLAAVYSTTLILPGILISKF